MDSTSLIHAIVRQTTILIAQLSTAMGIRAPLAHIADEVFLALAQEIEAQGLGKKVVADMFGLALRSYQKKVQRLEESETQGNTTLWEGVYTFIQENDGSTRLEVENHFREDDAQKVGAVLNDLVGEGHLSKTGRGLNTYYTVTDSAALAHLDELERNVSQRAILWSVIYRLGVCSFDDIVEQIRWDPVVVEERLQELADEDKVDIFYEDNKRRFEAAPFLVPVGSQAGWEAAVFDHYQAMVNAITKKVRSGNLSSRDRDRVGGATLSFDVYDGHPFEEEVRDLLPTIRAEVNELWDKVTDYNKATPPPREFERVWFYFGQYTMDNVRNEESDA